MSVAIVTGSSGLVGSETATFFHKKGFDVVGIDNDMRSYFFGMEASIAWRTQQLEQMLSRFRHYPVDIRDEEAILKIFRTYQKDIEIIVHCAAQPSHDWAAK